MSLIKLLMTAKQLLKSFPFRELKTHITVERITEATLRVAILVKVVTERRTMMAVPSTRKMGLASLAAPRVTTAIREGLLLVGITRPPTENSQMKSQPILMTLTVIQIVILFQIRCLTMTRKAMLCSQLFFLPQRFTPPLHR